MKQLFYETKETISGLFFTLALYNIHLLAVLLLFFGLSGRLAEEVCDSGVRVSPYDLAIGNSYFYFYHTEIWNKFLYFLDQPALQFSSFFTKATVSLTSINAEQSSWLFAVIVLASTTVQWLAVGYIIDIFRRRRKLR